MRSNVTSIKAHRASRLSLAEIDQKIGQLRQDVAIHRGIEQDYLAISRWSSFELVRKCREDQLALARTHAGMAAVLQARLAAALSERSSLEGKSHG